MLLSYVLPLSDRSGVNIKGVSATSQLDLDESEEGVQEINPNPNPNPSPSPNPYPNPNQVAHPSRRGAPPNTPAADTLPPDSASL